MCLPKVKTRLSSVVFMEDQWTGFESGEVEGVRVGWPPRRQITRGGKLGVPYKKNDFPRSTNFVKCMKLEKRSVCVSETARVPSSNHSIRLLFLTVSRLPIPFGSRDMNADIT